MPDHFPTLELRKATSAKDPHPTGPVIVISDGSEPESGSESESDRANPATPVDKVEVKPMEGVVVTSSRTEDQGIPESVKQILEDLTYDHGMLPPFLCLL